VLGTAFDPLLNNISFGIKFHGGTKRKAKLCSASKQGCQIFQGTIYQYAVKHPKLPQNIPNAHKIYQMVAKQTKCQ
jgi:hypothetical protein